MKTYGEYRPTGFDRAGAFLPDQQSWLVVPCGRNRDSGPFDESNFHVALELLGGESDSVQVHRFGHWACGWFEIIIVDPNSPAATIAQDIERRIKNYPLLNEDDASEREWEAKASYWDGCSISERVEYCRRAGISIFAARHDSIPEDIYDLL